MKKVIKLEPQGFCGGVRNALNIAYKTLENDSTLKPIYLLGNLIHNSFVIKDLNEKGIITIDEKGKTRLELLDLIDRGTVIFSAHGVEPKVYQKAKIKGLNIVDATCPYVKKVHDNIESYLKNNYEIIYIGKLNHPECEGILGISNKIHLVNEIDDIDKLNISNNLIYVTNQTTLSIFDIEIFYNKIKSIYPNAIIDDKICNATTVRQKTIMEQETVDLAIVIGDPKSSNTNKLYHVSKDIRGLDTIFGSSLNELDKEKIKKANSISITSGASTPSFLVDEVIEYIKGLE